MTANRVDILMLSETKLDESFPSAQFNIPGYGTPYRQDRNCNGVGILVYIREDIPSKQIHTNQQFIESMFIEINFRKQKWLLSCNYNPHNSLISNHLEEVGRSLDKCTQQYEKVLLIGDFNAESNDNSVQHFCNLYDLDHLIKTPTCYKNPENPLIINLFMTNSPKSFQNSCVFETGLSDFHHMTVTVLKTTFKKQGPKIITYRDYKDFSNELFRNTLIEKMGEKNESELSLSEFIEINNEIVDNLAPVKKRYIRSNQAPFMSRALQKSFMTRSRLRNRFLENRTNVNKTLYKKQRSTYCVNLLRKEKCRYYENLNIKEVTDNKKFWSTIKPLFSNKCASKNKITLIENDQLLSDNKDVAETSNDFFTNVVQNLGIPENEDLLTDTHRTSDLLFQAIFKYQKHPSIEAIQYAVSNKEPFNFSEVSEADITKEIKNLLTSKASQQSNVPTKILKKNIDVYA